MSQQSMYDASQITRMGFDDELKAHRMVLIGNSGIIEAAPSQGSFAVTVPNSPIIVPQTVQIERIEVPVIVKEVEIREIQIPHIVKEIEIREIERIVHVDRFMRVEVPVIVKETVIERIEIPSPSAQIQAGQSTQVQIIEKDLPKWVKVALAAQFIISILMLLKK